MQIHATIKDGRVQLSPPAKGAMQRYCAALKDGQAVDITIAKHRRQRSDAQNRRYWSGVGLIADHTGHTKEEVHAYLGELFRTDRSGQRADDPIPHIQSTRRMTTAEHSEYMDRCEAWAIQLFDIAFPGLEDTYTGD